MSSTKKEPETTAEDAAFAELLARVGARIRELRRMQGLTLAALGEFIQMDEAVISRIEAGKMNISLKTADRIARGLGVHLHELVLPRDQSSVRPKKSRKRD